MQHPDGIDVVEGPLSSQVQQAPVFDAELGLLKRTGAAAALPSHLQRSRRNIHSQDLGPWIQVSEVVGTHAGPAARIQDS